MEKMYTSYIKYKLFVHYHIEENESDNLRIGIQNVYLYIYTYITSLVLGLVRLVH